MSVIAINSYRFVLFIFANMFSKKKSNTFKRVPNSPILRILFEPFNLVLKSKNEARGGTRRCAVCAMNYTKFDNWKLGLTQRTSEKWHDMLMYWLTFLQTRQFQHKSTYSFLVVRAFPIPHLEEPSWESCAANPRDVLVSDPSVKNTTICFYGTSTHP